MISRVLCSIANYLGRFSHHQQQHHFQQQQQEQLQQPPFAPNRAAAKRQWSGDDCCDDGEHMSLKRVCPTTTTTAAAVAPSAAAVVYSSDSLHIIGDTPAPSVADTRNYTSSTTVLASSTTSATATVGNKMTFFFRPSSQPLSRHDSHQSGTGKHDSNYDDDDDDVRVIGVVRRDGSSNEVEIINHTDLTVARKNTAIGKRLFRRSTAAAASFQTAAAGTVCLSPGRRANTRRPFSASGGGCFQRFGNRIRPLMRSGFSTLNCFRLEEKSIYRQLLRQHLTPALAPAAPCAGKPPSIATTITCSSDSDVVVLLDRSSEITRDPPPSQPSRTQLSSWPIQNQVALPTAASPVTSHSLANHSQPPLQLAPPSPDVFLIESDCSVLSQERLERHIPASVTATAAAADRSYSPLSDSSVSVYTAPAASPLQSPAVTANGNGTTTSSSSSFDANINGSVTALPPAAATAAPSVVDRVSQLRLAVASRLHSYESVCERNRESRQLLQRQIAAEETRAALTNGHAQLEWERRLVARLRQQVRLAPTVVLEAEDELPDDDDEEQEEAEGEEQLVPLTDEMQRRIAAALRPNPAGEVLSKAYNLCLTRHDIQTLNGLNWLNDEVINFYMTMLMERSKSAAAASSSPSSAAAPSSALQLSVPSQQQQKPRPRLPLVYAFNTFFYGKIVDQGHAAVRRWTRKVDVFAHQLLLVPVHLGMHWCLLAADTRRRRVTFYDSMGSHNERALDAMLNYLAAEHRAKKDEPLDTSAWSTHTAQDIPQQMNGSDCGMFACKFAEYLSRDAAITFSQQDMPYFRRRMVYELITNTLL